MTLATQLSPASALDVDPNWWRGAVIHQIYPRSFQDSIGDRNGIVEHLDDVASLRVNAIWISPFFNSPKNDFGHDVIDYLDVEPMFGTLADVDRLVTKAHGLGLRVLAGLVLSHTSDLHHWFIESRARRQPEIGLVCLGRSRGRRQYYLHHFLAERPDLDVDNPEVQDVVLPVAGFWLKRGVDGFRLDAPNFSFKTPSCTTTRRCLKSSATGAMAAVLCGHITPDADENEKGRDA